MAANEVNDELQQPAVPFAVSPAPSGASAAVASQSAFPDPPSATADPRSLLFRTDHLHEDLKGRSIRGGAATLAGQGANFLLKLGSTAVLARLLTPADYGLIAMVTAVTGFVEMFKDAGLSMATVQRAEINHRQISTLFWFNLGLSVLLMLIVMALAPAVAWFYGEPQLFWITVALGAMFPLGGLIIQHNALLRRQMHFGTLVLIDVASNVVGVAAAITAALFGARYWALVAMMGGSSLAGVILTCLACPWLPGLPARGSGVRPMLAFGGEFTLAQLFFYWNRNIDNVLLGFAWGAGPLGFYTKAYQLLFLPIQLISGPISAVLVPALSRLQQRPEEFRRTYCNAVEIMVALGAPLVTFCLFDARSFIVGILGWQWEPTVLLFRALGPAALMGTVNIAGGSVLLATGRADKLVRVGLCSFILCLAAFLFGLRWGALGVAAAVSIAYTVLQPLAIAYSLRGTQATMLDFAKAIRRPLFASACGAAALCLFQSLGMSIALTYDILLDAIVFFGACFGTWQLLPGGRQAFVAIPAAFLRWRPDEAPNVPEGKQGDGPQSIGQSI